MSPTPDASRSGTFAIGGDLPVHRLGFGAMRLRRGDGAISDADRHHAHAVLRRAVELGTTLIDTAPLYGPSEELIGEALRPVPEGVLIATKVGIRHVDGAFVHRGRPDQVREDCETSLRLLGLDAIGLSQLHDIDPAVPIEETVGALASLRDEGKVVHVGLSNVTVEDLRRAQAVTPIASVQNRFSLAQRASQDVVDVCRDEGIAFLPWQPLARDGLGPAAARTLASAAERLGATPRQVALAWQLGHAPVVLPIPGTGDLAHLEENVGAAGLELTTEERAALDAG